MLQDDNDLPVHLKGGAGDALLYRATMVLTVMGKNCFLNPFLNLVSCCSFYLNGKPSSLMVHAQVGPRCCNPGLFDPERVIIMFKNI